MTWEEIKKKIEITSIISCTVKYKNTQFEEIIIDCYGFDGILKLDDISINISLAKELFRIIRKDDSFDAVVVGFDNDKRKVLLNTKVFRTNLDNILSFTKCRNLIENNRQTHLSIDNKFLKSHRNILDRLRGDLSSNELTFLYELIQNAVDHPNKNFNNVSINFEVFNNYLLVKHSGALFTENNFESITGILYGEQIQEGEQNRIGYKGIGFKSVFRFTDNAYIRSGNFSFRFSKEESGSDKPWEVLPLFQLEKDIVTQIPQFDFFNAPVAFAFEFNSDQSKNYVIKYLNQLSQNPYLLIFLVNLTQLKIKAPSLSYIANGANQSFSSLEVNFVKEITKKEGFDSINLYVNNNSHSEWLIHTKNDIVITDVEVINELLNESVTAVPAKMRHFRTPRITIALPKSQLNDDVINLFTYLPLSNSKFKLPFLVNADFIPDLDRTDIIYNLKYNNEVLKFVALTLEELSRKLAQNNQFDYLNTLLPDLGIDYQSSANIIVNKLLEFLPNTELTFNGQQLPFSNIIIDKSGFVGSFGLEIFKDLIDKVNVPLRIFEDYKKIAKIIEKINPNNVFDFVKLKENVKSEPFKIWLKHANNNLGFIKYLISKKYLDVFSHELIFLAEDGDLYKGTDVFINLGSDSISLEWLGFKKVLHRSVSSELINIQLPLLQYDPISFIKDIICKQQKNEIILALNNCSISFNDVYSYLSKYAGNPLFPADEIKSFPVQTKQATLPNWSTSIYFNSNPLNTILSNKSLPSALFYLLDDMWNSETNSEFNELAVKLGVLSFLEPEPFNFIKAILVANKVKICGFYLSETNVNINASAAFWSFIISVFRNLSDPQKEVLKPILKAFPVLSKKTVFKELHTLYLPAEFTDNDALETLSLQFPHSNIDFISADYLQYDTIDKNEIKALFRRLDAKIDTKDFLQHTLLPNLQHISEDLFVPLTRLIYENRESEQIINSVLSSNSFRLKTKEGSFKTIKESFIGSHYINEEQIPNPLDFVPVINQVSTEYSDNHPDAWRKFFTEKLKINSLLNEQEILSLKLKYISVNIDIWKIKEKSVLLFNELYSLFKSGKLSLSAINLTYIKNIPLLCNGNDASYVLPNMLNFPAAYKPTFDFEKIFGTACGVHFLSEAYKFEDDKQVVLFFEQLGVTQYFDKNRHSILLQNIPTSDGQSKPANQIFKYEFKKIVGDSNVAYKDLSQITNNGRTLEEYLGFISKLNVSSILMYISKSQPDKRELKQLITELIKVYNPSNINDKSLINDFILLGKLLSTAKTYNSVKELNWIDESIRSGIRENEYLVDPLFSKQDQERERFLKLFNINKIGIENFNPHFDGEHPDYEFTNRVKERLVFLAFDSDNEKYLEIEKEFKEKFKEWQIKKCSKISLKYPKIDSKIIKDDSKTFEIVVNKILYYIGKWNDPRVNPVIVDCLSRNIIGIYKQREFLQDILLNEPKDIIAEFENKSRIVPEEIKLRFRIPQPIQQPIQQEINTQALGQSEHATASTKDKETTDEVFENPFKDISPADESFVRSIIRGDFELDEKLDANTTAKIKTLLAIKGQYELSEITDEGRFLKAGEVEILVRSAQSGILYLDVYHWGRLSEENVRLSVYTKSQIIIYSSQEQLIQFTKPQNKFGIVRMPAEYATVDYNSLDKITDKGKWHFVFIVNENTKAAQSYKEVMNLEDYNF